MSSERTEQGRLGLRVATQPEGTSRRTASIARSITWGFWWRKLVTWLTVNVAMAGTLAALFTWQCAGELPPQALDGITTTIVGARVIRAENLRVLGLGEGMDAWTYQVRGADGTLYNFAIAPYLRMVAPFGIAMGIIELLDLCDFVSDTRRVRRRLQPLNDLAVTAEVIGNVAARDPMIGTSNDKMATLEAAIARASVDAPQVATGDADLASIEVALNGLLRQMQEAKLQQMRFVSDASHELRTPIAVIQGYVNMLDRWGKTDEAVLSESIEALKGESKHMQELVEQLLFLARGDSGRNTLQHERLNLAGLVREVWEESCMIDEAHAYTCDATEADATDDTYVAYGDLAMIKQSLRVIVGNAAKYSPAGSTIRLSALVDKETVSYVVSDEGIGMSEQDVTHVFDRFWRADAGRDSGAEGTGLGLSIAKWIVDAHGGAITILTREGVGTRFTVSLPRPPAAHSGHD